MGTPAAELIAIDSLHVAPNRWHHRVQMDQPTLILRQIRTRSACRRLNARWISVSRSKRSEPGTPVDDPCQRLSSSELNLKAKHSIQERVPLHVLTDELHVHLRTLRAAAHDGRLAATFGPRPFLGKLTATPRRWDCRWRSAACRRFHGISGGRRNRCDWREGATPSRGVPWSCSAR